MTVEVTSRAPKIFIVVKDLEVSYRFDELSTESKSKEDPNYDPDNEYNKKL